LLGHNFRAKGKAKKMAKKISRHGKNNKMMEEKVGYYWLITGI